MINKISRKKYTIVNKFRFFTFILFLIILIVCILVIFTSNRAYSSIYEEKYIEVEVEQGDTLWCIAKKYMPKGYDVRKMVFELREFNNMQDVRIYPGDIIRIPDKYN